MTFLAPAQFLPPKLHRKHQQTFGNTWPYANTLPRTKRAPDLSLLRVFRSWVDLNQGDKWGENRVYDQFLQCPCSLPCGHSVHHEVLNERSVSQLSAGTFGFHVRALVREQRLTKEKWSKLTTLLGLSAIFVFFLIITGWQKEYATSKLRQNYTFFPKKILLVTFRHGR